MKKTIATIIVAFVLSGCQTADETLTTSSTPIAVTGATASAIAGDLASLFRRTGCASRYHNAQNGQGHIRIRRRP